MKLIFIVLLLSFNLSMQPMQKKNNKDLIVAISQSNIPDIQNFLIENPLFEEKNGEFYTDENPFYYAIAKGEINVVKEFILQGFDPTKKIQFKNYDSEIHTLSEFAQERQHNAITMLFNRYSELRNAVLNDNKKKITKLLQRKDLFIDARFEFGRTLLHLACFYRKCNAAQALLENKANIHALDSNSYSCLYLACTEKSYEPVAMDLLDILLKSGAQLDYAFQKAQKENDANALKYLNFFNRHNLEK